MCSKYYFDNDAMNDILNIVEKQMPPAGYAGEQGQLIGKADQGSESMLADIFSERNLTQMIIFNDS